MGGMVLETNMIEIITRIEEQNKLEKQEVSRRRNDCYYRNLCCISLLGWDIGGSCPRRVCRQEYELAAANQRHEVAGFADN